MSKIISTKKTSAIFLATVLVAGIIGISSSFTVYAQQYERDYESSYYPSDLGMTDGQSGTQIQKAECDNKNNNENDLNQAQRQQGTVGSGGFNNGDDSLAGQDFTPEEALAALTGNGDGTSDPLLNIDRNIVNVCFNTNAMS